MENLSTIFKDSENVYHAYFLIGERDIVFNDLKSGIEKRLKIKTSGNPDFWSGDFHNFNIEEARSVVEMAGQKSFSETKKLFVIKTDFVGVEAQNALLKVFEEPTANTHFFLIC